MTNQDFKDALTKSLGKAKARLLRKHLLKAGIIVELSECNEALRRNDQSIRDALSWMLSKAQHESLAGRLSELYRSFFR